MVRVRARARARERKSSEGIEVCNSTGLRNG